MPAPDVSVVIVSYEGRALLEQCLDALVAHSGERSLEIIVVDQASTDRTAQWLGSERPEIRVVALEQNVGFGAGNNRGAAIAEGRYLLLLNSDAFVTPGAIDELVRFAEQHPQAGVVAPRLLWPDGQLQRSCRRFPTPFRIATEYLFLRKFAPHSRALNGFYCAEFPHDEPKRVDWLTGAALLIPRELYERLGGFDEAFFMFSEEVDLSRRAKALGYATWFDPVAEVKHVWGATAKRDPGPSLRENLRSQVRYLDKHEGRRTAVVGRAILLGGMLLRVPKGPTYRSTAAWLARRSVEQLLRSATSDAGTPE